jgi:heme/copper-type cytochrome/quinol oxidase subunit 2
MNSDDTKRDETRQVNYLALTLMLWLFIFLTVVFMYVRYVITMRGLKGDTSSKVLYGINSLVSSL